MHKLRNAAPYLIVISSFTAFIPCIGSHLYTKHQYEYTIFCC